MIKDKKDKKINVLMYSFERDQSEHFKDEGVHILKEKARRKPLIKEIFVSNNDHKIGTKRNHLYYKKQGGWERERKKEGNGIEPRNNSHSSSIQLIFTSSTS
ncbi:hypothetical protein RFI_31768, partial [Reticulomyxa filosa]